MKTFTLLFLSLFIYSVGKSQGPVTDTHPLSQIFVLNYQSGQEVQASNDDAILFKDAFIDLVRNTPISQQILGATQGRKIAVVKQIDPQKLNGYQLTWQSVGGQNRALCTFYYNIDQNALYFYDLNQRNWTPVNVEGNNINNLNNCQAYCKFNSNSSSDMPDLSVSNAPVSDDVATQEDVSANAAPPALPEYEQPACPVDGYLWQPGYWAYSRNANDYYWVPGVWIAPPNPGLYWTPCYWGYAGNVYVFHRGYWGPSVGFYGGINYGFGYVGVGYVGGEWRGREFSYNTAVVRVNTTVIHNTYVNRTVINNTTVVNRTSFNGRGGVTAAPTQQEQVAARQPHINPTAAQMSHQQSATVDKSQFASVNRGRPAVTSVARVTPMPAASRNNNPSAPNNNRTPGNNQTGNTPNPNGGGNRGNGNPTGTNSNPNGAANRANGNPTGTNSNPNGAGNRANGNQTGTAPNPNGGSYRANGNQSPNTNGNNVATPNNENRTPGNQADKATTPTGSTTPSPSENKAPGNQPNANPNNKNVNPNTPDNRGQRQQQRQLQPKQQQPKQQKPPKQREKPKN